MPITAGSSRTTRSRSRTTSIRSTSSSARCASSTRIASRPARASARTATATWRSSATCSTGELAHRDSIGNGSTIRPGDVQRMSAGRGVRHSEFNPSPASLVHFLQIWIQPNVEGIEPSYEEKRFAPEEKRGRLRLIASPDQSDGSVLIHQDARVYAGLFDGAESASLESRAGPADLRPRRARRGASQRRCTGSGRCTEIERRRRSYSCNTGATQRYWSSICRASNFAAMSRPIDLAVPVSAVDHALGAEHSPVTVVEYGDFECPTCKQAAPAVKLMLERFGNRIRFVFRHFPVEVGASACDARRASRRSGRRARQVLADARPAVREPAPSEDGQPARVRGAPGARHAALHRGDGRRDLPAARARAHAGRHASHVRGTPTFFINGVIQDVSFGMHALIDGVEAEVRRVER